MKPYRHFLFYAALGALALTSCSESFLDKIPDERTDIDTEDKVINLLKSAYPSANYMWEAELMSDNFIDNWAPHMPTKPWDPQVLSHYNYPSYARFDDQLYAFEPASYATYSDWDSPGMMWEGYYGSISTCNAALQAIEEISEGKALTPKLKAAKAEALLIRAYSHFCLVNMFSEAWKSPEKSKNDIGIPYVKEVEDRVTKHYDRGNVAEVYDNIQADLEEGLANLSEEYYTVPKWHFNVNAAHAFAARFYLYKRDWAKVVEHANAVLGTDNSTLMNMMMDYSVFKDCSTGDDYSNAWQHPNLNNNLMLISTYSVFYRRCFGYRYSIAGPKAREVFLINTRHQLWSSYYVCPIANVGGMCFGNSSHDYGFINSKIFEQFEYSDKIAQIGYPHIIVRAFTANELLLNRAEAKIMLGQIDAGVEDLCAYWNNSIERFSEADYKAYFEAGYIKKCTKQIIEKYYSNGDNNNCYHNWDFTKNVSSDYVVPAENVAYMNCLNEFRRFETMFEGLRFFDLKRWGINWSHEIGVEATPYQLTTDDPRKAIEAPWEVISAGMASSRPTMQGIGSSNLVKLDPEESRIK
jgi:hypothetical protein